MKEFKFTIHGNEYEVEVKQLEEGIGKIEVNGTLYEVELHKIEEKASKTPILMRTPLPTSKGAHRDMAADFADRGESSFFRIDLSDNYNCLDYFLELKQCH